MPNENFLIGQQSSSWIEPLLIAILAVVVGFLLMRSNIGRAARRDQRLSTQYDMLKAGREPRAEVDEVMVALEQFARDMNAQVDTKCARLEQLIADADERLERLAALGRRLRADRDEVAHADPLDESEVAAEVNEDDSGPGVRATERGGSIDHDDPASDREHDDDWYVSPNGLILPDESANDSESARAPHNARRSLSKASDDALGDEFDDEFHDQFDDSADAEFDAIEADLEREATEQPGRSAAIDDDDVDEYGDDDERDVDDGDAAAEETDLPSSLSEPRIARIYALSDEGHTASAISRLLHMPVGEVELVIGLRSMEER